MQNILRGLKIVLLVGSVLGQLSCGGGSGGSIAQSVATPGNTAGVIPVPTNTLSLLAGNVTGPGNADGTGAAALFDAPLGTVVDSLGNVFVVDTNYLSIRKITPSGVVSTFAGNRVTAEPVDGAGTDASFIYPHHIAIDRNDNLYVIDLIGVRKITPGGVVSTVRNPFGAVGVTSATFVPVATNFHPNGIAVDSRNNVYMTYPQLTTIRMIPPVGASGVLTVTTGAGFSIGGDVPVNGFSFLQGITTDSSDNLYVVDNNFIKKITPTGAISPLVNNLPTSFICQPSAYSGYCYARSLTVDTSGNLFFVAAESSTIQKVGPSGVVTTLAGNDTIVQSDDGIGSAAHFRSPQGISIDRDGNLFVADCLDGLIRKISSAGEVTTLAGAKQVVGSADGLGGAARFNLIVSLAADAAGNVFAGDYYNNTLRKIDVNGVVSTLAGSPGTTKSIDGNGSAASFSSVNSVATDANGNIIVADGFGHVIRKVTLAGNVSTIAGKANAPGFANGAGLTAAYFNTPASVTADSAGNIYVSDTSNRLVRKINPQGDVSTLAGALFVQGTKDGVGSAANFWGPGRLAVDAGGTVYITDVGRIRKLTPDGTVSTLAGLAGVNGSVDGTGSAARFGVLSGITISSSGNLYVSDLGNNTIRKITPDGVVSTVIGVSGQGKFVPGVLPGSINKPRGLAIRGNKMYIAMYNGIAVANEVP
jgi:sugar lactone lactonase YvrE